MQPWVQTVESIPLNPPPEASASPPHVCVCGSQLHADRSSVRPAQFAQCSLHPEISIGSGDLGVKPSPSLGGAPCQRTRGYTRDIP